MLRKAILALICAFVLLVFSSTGLMAEDDEEEFVFPGPPANVTVTIAKDGYRVQWEEPAEDSDEVTGYEVVRSPRPGGPYRKVVHVPRNVLSYKDTTANMEVKYYYKVRAQAGTFYSEYSSPASLAETEPQKR